MNHEIITFEHDCAGSLGESEEDRPVSFDTIRVNQWPHAEQALILENVQRRATDLTLYPEPGEIIKVPYGTYRLNTSHETNLLSSWTDELECFSGMELMPRKMSGQTYPLIRGIGIAPAGTVSANITPRHSGRMRIIPSASSASWEINTIRKCGASTITYVHSGYNIVNSCEHTGGRPTGSSFYFSPYLFAGIRYSIMVRNTHATNTDDVSIDVSIEPQDG